MSDRVRFNVGGRIVETARSTILKYPDSVLAKHIGPLGKPDRDGTYFIDRDPEAFGAIMNFYRSNLIACPPSVNKELFEEELKFWQIRSIQDPHYEQKLKEAQDNSYRMYAS
jgi:hypothetical protein